MSESLNKLFVTANFKQKRMMLQLTNSMTERAIWLKGCEAKEALALIRADNKAALIEYELLQLCTQQQQERMQNLMSRADNKKYSLWQNMRELGMSDKTFEDFRKPENQATRAIDLPTSEEVYNQIEFPG